MALYDPVIFSNYPGLIEQTVLLIEMLQLNNLYIQENPIFTDFTQSSVTSTINTDNLSDSPQNSYYRAEIQLAVTQRSSLTDKTTLAERVRGDNTTHLSALEFPRKADYNHLSAIAPPFPSQLLNANDPALSVAEKRLFWLFLRIQDLINFYTEWNYYHSLAEQVTTSQEGRYRTLQNFSFNNNAILRRKACVDIIESLIAAGSAYTFPGYQYPVPEFSGNIILYDDRDYQQILSTYTQSLLPYFETFPLDYRLINDSVEVAEFDYSAGGDGGNNPGSEDISGSESEENFFDPAITIQFGSDRADYGSDAEPTNYQDAGSGQDPQNTLPDC